MLIIGRKDVTTELIANAESPVSRCVSTAPVIIFEFDINYLQAVSIQYYYIDRFHLWGFIPEINSGISHVRYHFFPRQNYLYPTISVLSFTSLVVLW